MKEVKIAEAEPSSSDIKKEKDIKHSNECVVEDQLNPENTLEALQEKECLDKVSNSDVKLDEKLECKAKQELLEDISSAEEPIEHVEKAEEHPFIQLDSQDDSYNEESKHDKSPALDESVKKEMEEVSEDEVEAPPKVNYILPGEKEA